jgi:hypothetical protein
MMHAQKATLDQQLSSALLPDKKEQLMNDMQKAADDLAKLSLSRIN